MRPLGFSWRLAAPINSSQTEIDILSRAELGVPPGEIVYATGLLDAEGARDTVALRRGQESTAASDWPVGTPFTWLRDAGDAGDPVVHNLARALPASATQVSFRHAYRRAKLDSEIVWVYGSTVNGDTDAPIDVLRGQESTTPATHLKDAELSWLAAGAS
jgi:hypothetical protein